MPFEWIDPAEKAPERSGAFSRSDAAPPVRILHVWPYRSLPRRGFVLFIALTCALIAVPLLALLGTPVLWGLLPFFVVVVAGLWYALQRSYRDGELLEELALWPDSMVLVRHNPRGPQQQWQANPYWVRIALHETGGPLENYITLKGGGREVEIGAFLSPEERKALHASLQEALLHLR